MRKSFQANLCSRAADLVSSKCLTSVQEAEPSQQLLRNQRHGWVPGLSMDVSRLPSDVHPQVPGLLRTVVVLPELQGEVYPSRQVLGLVTLSPISWTLAEDNLLAICCLPVALGEAILRIPSCLAQAFGNSSCVHLQTADLHSASRLTVSWELLQKAVSSCCWGPILLYLNYGFDHPSMMGSPAHAKARRMHVSILAVVQGKDLVF